MRKYSDTQVLVDPMLSDVVERANNVEVDAILSRDENDIERWWDGAARERIQASIKYHIIAWQLGRSIPGEITTICP